MIEFRNVSFSHGSQAIFSRFSFRLERSEYLVISGAARAGKTTLVQIIAGLILPDEGEAVFDGEYLEDIVRSKIKLRNHRRQIGGVGGIYSLLGDRTVIENVTLAPEIAGVSYAAARRRGMEVLGKYRLTHIASLYPGSISEVERRTAQIARADAARKNLIVADSPTDGLDPQAARFINERLAALHLAGAAILYLTSGSGPQNGPDRYLRIEEGGVLE